MKEYSFYLTAENNIFDPDSPDAGLGYDFDDENVNYNTSAYMECSGADSIYVNAKDVSGYWRVSAQYYDKEKNLISGHSFNGQYGVIPAFQSAALPEGTAYIRVAVLTRIWENVEVYQSKEVYPVYSDSLSKDYEKENNEQFFREKLNGKLTFVGVDYDHIDRAAFDTVFRVQIYRTGTDAPYFTGTFMKTDGEWDADGKTCTVELEVSDGYNGILANIENEYNLLELAPETERCVVTKRPLLQVYTPGQDVVTNILGATYWEQEVAETLTADFRTAGSNDDPLTNNYKLGLSDLFMAITVGTPDVQLVPSVSGTYSAQMRFFYNDAGTTFIITGTLKRPDSDDYYIEYTYNYNPTAGVSTSITIRNKNGQRIFFFTGLVVVEDGSFSMQGDNDVFSGLDARVQCDKESHYVYTRLLLDVATYPLASGDKATSDIPENDFVADTENYKKVLIVEDRSFATFSSETQEEPTEWGKAENGGYYVQPQGYTIPISRSEWGVMSVWGAPSSYRQLDAPGRKPYILRDSYPLSSCISVLLRKVAPELSHEPTEEYSKFLYADINPVSRLWGLTLLVTPKSNILKGEYDEPARKAPVTLKQITDMLRDCFRCYWYVEDNKFKIEHISFFNNGMSYDSAQRVIGIDLTQMINPRNGKDWGYCTSKWKFEKEQMPERYQFGWMDDVTKTFEGQPIEILSPYVEKGLTEEVNVGNFTTDIDYMLIAPGEISEDGFALLWATGLKPMGYDRMNKALNYRIDPATGKAVADTSYYITAFYSGNFGTSGIEVIPGMKYKLSKAYPGAWYDYYGRYISGFNPSQAMSGNPATITAPDNAFYYVATFKIGEEDTSTFTSQQYELPISEALPSSGDYMQNPYLSFTYLQPNFYVYDLPARKALINGTETEAKGIKRNKTQEVSVPSPSDPDVQELVRTHIGDGQIDKASINLSSRMAKLTLRYDTEQ